MDPESRIYKLARDVGIHHEAFRFIYAALEKAVAGKKQHISARKLLMAIKEVGHERFGYLTKVVFNQWGIHRTSDWGTVVYALVNADMLGKQESDNQTDFDSVYDFEEALVKSFKFEPRRSNG
jgi:uncharacterized repeat protein (TIGR04138 family)